MLSQSAPDYDQTNMDVSTTEQAGQEAQERQETRGMVIMLNLCHVYLKDGINGHPFMAVAEFDNGTEWVIRMPYLAQLCEGIGLCEDMKYRGGLGRNYFLLAHLFPIYKKYLIEHKFTPSEYDLSKCIPLPCPNLIVDMTKMKVFQLGKSELVEFPKEQMTLINSQKTLKKWGIQIGT